MITTLNVKSLNISKEPPEQLQPKEWIPEPDVTEIPAPLRGDVDTDTANSAMTNFDAFLENFVAAR
ncbi:hypothetical protein [Collimonas sp. OK412]|jgi:hypothetical protein|uniref:hypothetical protein n=1 Tax=Collimonas sp. (strain OK412) TaxID=1801619 RepID=UPI0008E59254|nr:hypothetical protein [Collimonas sp. OK412]SFD03087.1 hypothetical protein SAMN04515619_1205 [Collimonas sp. OK412]